MKVSERSYKVGKRLYQARRMRVLTQKQLAEISGVHDVTISDIERGARKASARTVKSLAEALDIDVKDLIESDIP